MKSNISARQFRLRSGFTLAEAVVCAAIAGMTFVFAAPALNKGRDGTDRVRCENNLRQLSRAHLMYAGDHAGFCPSTLSMTNGDYAATQPGPGGWYDGHAWYSLIGAYLGDPDFAALIHLNVSLSSPQNDAMRRAGFRLKVYACPADIGMQKGEWVSANWARVYANYVVNAGNTNYGQTANNGVPFLGAPFAGARTTPLATITDGLSNTLMMSEVPVLRGCESSWGGTYSSTQSALGGQVFVGYNPPNPTVSDGIGYGLNGNGTCGSSAGMQARYVEAGVIPLPVSAGSSPLATYISARSKHPGGVNASLCDGSAGFVTNDIDPSVWRALSSARGSDFVPPTQSPPNARTK